MSRRRALIGQLSHKVVPPYYPDQFNISSSAVVTSDGLWTQRHQFDSTVNIDMPDLTSYTQWSIRCAFRMTGTSEYSNYLSVIGSSLSNQAINIGAYKSDGTLFLDIGDSSGSSWQFTGGSGVGLTSYAISLNTRYDVIVSYNNGTYTMQISTDEGETWQTILNVAGYTNISYSSAYNMSLMTQRNPGWGHSIGQMWLNYLIITGDGQQIFPVVSQR